MCYSVTFQIFINKYKHKLIKNKEKHNDFP